MNVMANQAASMPAGVEKTRFFASYLRRRAGDYYVGIDPRDVEVRLLRETHRAGMTHPPFRS